MYHVDGDLVEAVEAGVRYQINMLDLKAEDLQGIVFNPYHIPKPAIRSERPPCFVLPLSHIIRYGIICPMPILLNFMLSGSSGYLKTIGVC